MPDLVLNERPPLAGIAGAGRFGKPAAAGVIIQEVTGLGVASLTARKGKAAALREAVRSTFAVDLPTTPRRAAANGVAFLGIGPAQWLAVFDRLPPGGVEAALAPACAGLASVADQSDARAVLRVRGGCARAALAKGLPIDLHERSFRPGCVASTVVWSIPVLAAQRDEAPTYELFVPRSFAGSFWHWLTQASAEFGYEVTASGN